MNRTRQNSGLVRPKEDWGGKARGLLGRLETLRLFAGVPRPPLDETLARFLRRAERETKKAKKKTKAQSGGFQRAFERLQRARVSVAESLALRPESLGVGHLMASQLLEQWGGLLGWSDHAASRDVAARAIEALEAFADFEPEDWYDSLVGARGSAAVVRLGGLRFPRAARSYGGGMTPAARKELSLRRRLLEVGDSREKAAALKEHLDIYGAGRLKYYLAFRWSENHAEGSLRGLTQIETHRLEDLVGYEEEQALLVENTEAFLDGQAANNVLLYGARGTGKSSSIKALLTPYGRRGLRLIEISKQHLNHLHQLLELLEGRPEKFVLFIDDLSYESDDTSYKQLKVALDGTVEMLPPNVLVYATSNTKDLVKRREDEEDPFRAAQRVDEKRALDDRFGLKILFQSPDQEQAMRMVESHARRAGLELDSETLHSE
ncbi:MAG: DUF815 domain-containing protein, partial [bacterium]